MFCALPKGWTHMAPKYGVDDKKDKFKDDAPTQESSKTLLTEVRMDVSLFGGLRGHSLADSKMWPVRDFFAKIAFFALDAGCYLSNITGPAPLLNSRRNREKPDAPVYKLPPMDTSHLPSFN